MRKSADSQFLLVIFTFQFVFMMTGIGLLLWKAWLYRSVDDTGTEEEKDERRTRPVRMSILVVLLAGGGFWTKHIYGLIQMD